MKNYFRWIWMHFHLKVVPSFLFYNSWLIFLIFTERKSEFLARVWMPVEVVGAGQKPVWHRGQRQFCCCICAACFHQFSLSAVGVVVLASAPTVQLDVDARCLATASGAEESAPRPWFGPSHPCTDGVRLWLWSQSVPQHLRLGDDGVGNKSVAVLRQVNIVPVSVQF